jgi:flagellar biosynthesis/type III secretory pathway protein FliH
VEQTLFNPDPQPAKPRHWLDDTWLNSSSKPIANFGEFDWANVPKLDYATFKFKQLATPEPAKVLDEDSEFVLETFGKTQTFRQDGTAAKTALKDGHAPAQAALIEHPDTAPDEDPQLAAQLAAHQARLQAQAERDADMRLQREVFGAECMWRRSDEDDWQSDLPLGDDAPVIDPAALAAAREEAFAQGHTEGTAAGLQEGQSLGHAQGLSEGVSQGLEQAKVQAADALANALAAQKTELSGVLQEQLGLLGQVQDKLRAFSNDPQALFEPVKRLALHISEQLVLAELTISGQAIERLVQRCLDEIDLHGQSAVTIELNPQDKARLEDLGAEVIKQMQLQAVPGLQPGSVRLVVNDSQIEDLIEHRLQAMANRLLNQPELWREQSAFFRQPLAQRDGQVEDVPERVSFDQPQQEDDHA